MTAQLKPDVVGKASSIDKPISHDSTSFCFIFLDYIFIHGISLHPPIHPSIHCPSLHFTSLHLNLRNPTQPIPEPPNQKNQTTTLLRFTKPKDLRSSHSITGEETEAETEERKKEKTTQGYSPPHPCSVACKTCDASSCMPPMK